MTLPVNQGRPGSERPERLTSVCHSSYRYPVKTTIDKAGRVVVPKKLRDRYNLHAGSVLELEPEANGFRVTVAGIEPSMVRERGILVHHGPATVAVDVAVFLNRAREARVGEVVPEQPEE
jgi:AbrB family looped-hinge helix DNA binding protein